MKQLYKYNWGTNEKQVKLKGRVFELLAHGKLNSRKVRFIDTGQIEIISGNALRKVI
jgi:hypothetical protein